MKNSLMILILTIISIIAFADYIEAPFDKGDTAEIYYNDGYDKTLVDNSLNIIPLAALRFYQIVISPAQGEVCNFTPSCSNYMFKAIRKYGFLAGIVKGVDRLQRCNYSSKNYVGAYYPDIVLTKERGYKIIDNP